MNCWNLDCNLRARNSVECTHCHLRFYCSEVCLREDWNSVHSSQCKTQFIDLSDFFQVSAQPLLGKGAYGEVKLIKNKHTGQLIAQKQIKKMPDNQKAQMNLLYSEIKIQMSLNHKNITSLIEYKETASDMFLFLEYIDGGNLYTKIKKKVKFQEREAYKYFIQICSGIQYLHENNIIHRDIKPENILISKTGDVKICDFGWAIASSKERSTYCGTLDFMSPEVLRGGTYTNKVDIWSLGILLYELLQGHTPFNGKNSTERLSKMNEGKIEFSKDISRAAKTLILKMLSIDAKERPGINEIMNDDWIIRYSFNSPIICESLKSALSEDEFEMKLSRNYPSSYKRKLDFSSTISTGLNSANIEDKSDLITCSSIEAGDNKNVIHCFNPEKIKKTKDELSKLIKKLEVKENTLQNQGVFRPLTGACSLQGFQIFRLI